MITISYKPVQYKEKATVDELTMMIADEDANRDDLMRAFQQFLSGIGYVFSVEELGEYE